jgi:hypothetical protein
MDVAAGEAEDIIGPVNLCLRLFPHDRLELSSNDRACQESVLGLSVG